MIAELDVRLVRLRHSVASLSVAFVVALHVALSHLLPFHERDHDDFAFVVLKMNVPSLQWLALRT